MKDWSVYILECNDGTFYTGVTDDIKKRLAVHNTKMGAKYTRGRTPVVLRYAEKVKGRSEALRREIEIKRKTKKEKLELIKSGVIKSRTRIL